MITTRELGRLLRARGVALSSLESSGFDSPLGDSSGAAALFGTTGGVAEAALRSAFKALVGSEAPVGDGGGAGESSDKNPMRPLRGLAGVKELVLPLPEEGVARELAGGRSELRVAVASGAGAARALVERIREGDPSLPRFDFVEVMACPGKGESFFFTFSFFRFDGEKKRRKTANSLFVAPLFFPSSLSLSLRSEKKIKLPHKAAASAAEGSPASGTRPRRWPPARGRSTRSTPAPRPAGRTRTKP